MARAGLHKLQCEECGKVVELEAGITSMFCHAQKMVEFPEVVEEAEEQEPTLRVKPRQ